MTDNLNTMKIIKTDVINVVEGCYILQASNGEQYKLPMGSVPLEHGALLPVGNDACLQISLPQSDSDAEVDDCAVLLTSPTEQSVTTFDNSTVDTVDNSSEDKRKYAEWTDRATKLLITKYKELKPLVDNRKIKTMKRMWEIISENLKQCNFDYTPAQTETKWKTLERAFKIVVDNNMKSGRGKRKCPYERELADILLKQKNVVPPYVVDENSEKTRSAIIEESRLRNEALVKMANEEHQGSTNSSRSGTPLDETPVRRGRNQELKLLADAITHRSKQIQRLEDRNYEQRERFIKVLKEKNTLLQEIVNKLNPQ